MTVDATTGKSFLSIPKMSESTLIDYANVNHRLATKSLTKFLLHAKRAGTALRRAKKRHGRHGRWMAWVKENFDAGYTTATIYMRISRDWNSPKIKEAREERDICSIAQFMSLTKKAAEITGSGLEPNSPDKTESMRRSVATYFKEKLRRVEPKLISVMENDFEAIWAAALRVAKKLKADEDAEDYEFAEEHADEMPAYQS